MSKRYIGGSITRNPVTPSGPYLNSTASGIWGLNDVANFVRQGNWPTAGNINPNNYIENIFSTYLYTGNGSTQTITNGIDLAGEGGLVWLKQRTDTPAATSHIWLDTVRGASNTLCSDSTGAQNAVASASNTFNTTGFSILSTGANSNGSGATYASWTFRKQPKFFDVVTYTGNGTSQNIAHNLGSVPGCIIVKNLAAGSWYVYHRSTGNTGELRLNVTDALATSATDWNSTDPTSAVFSVGASAGTNSNGASFVAYLFAHDAGGFGLTGTDNVISCGSFTTDGSGNFSVNLGYEPQYFLTKRVDSTQNWYVWDTMRGWTVSGTANGLVPNSSSAEVNYAGGTDYFRPTATGITGTGNFFGTSATVIYVAIRRGPMKVPTDSTTVFGTSVRTGDDTSDPTITPTTAMVTDMTLTMNRSGGPGSSAGAGAVGGFLAFDRLRGYKALYTISTNPEPSPGAVGYSFARQNGVIGTGLDAGQFFNDDTNDSSYSYINYFFRRAPKFFDEVCYTGNSTNQTIAHNLGVAPELMIAKKRSGTGQWPVYAQPLGATKHLQLNTYSLEVTSVMWNNTAPTASVFSVGADGDSNLSGETYVAYIFATCPGVSKVGSYTGTGTTQTINCGFTAGSRFVMIKRTDVDGNWYVWDSARGINAGNDPYLLLDNFTVEVTDTDYIDPLSTGFEISSTAPAAINNNGGTFIFLAIA